MDDTHTNAEAGPSRPRPVRPLVPTRPVPDPPPATPPSTAKSQKRRSWFGITLGSPNIPPSPTPNATVDAEHISSSPTQKGSVERDRRRSSHSLISKEDVTLGPVAGSESEERQSVDNGSSEINVKGGRQSSNALAEEVLTIDGTPEKAVKKKKRRSKGDGEDGEVMRMSDLGGSSTLKGLGIRQHDTRKASLEHPPSEVINLSEPKIAPPQPFSIRTRTFSRTASDRDPFAPPEPSDPSSSLKPTSKSSSSSLANDRPDIQPRTSSISASQSSSPRIPSLQVDKSQPPLPVDVDRALPPLPSKNSGSSLKLTKPELPKGIVVTPSSPRKLSKTPKKPPLTQRRSRSATGYSRQFDGNKEKRSQSNNPNPAPESSIGLGLPSALLPSTKSNTDSPPPPPVPSKTQSVSSPFPSRTPSPIPTIAFVEPNGTPIVEKTEDQAVVEEKRKIVRRARSLSGFFGKSPPVVHHDKMPEVEHSESSPGASAGKSSGGVLEWLGVRKAVKRKTSETQVDAHPSADSIMNDPHRTPLPGHQVVDGGRASDRLSRTLEVSQSDSQQPTPRRSQYTLSPSTGTSIPLSEPIRGDSIFTRRASDRGTDDGAPRHPLPVVPMAIPNAGMRNHTALSSQSSSYNLPAHDPISPFIPGSGPWVSTPQSEKEEIIFSTPEAEGSNWGPGRRPWMEAGEYRNSSKSSLSTPLDILPEQDIPTLQSPLKAPPTVREGRVRSWSDAPRPPQNLVKTQPQSSNPHLPLPRPTTPNGTSLSLSASASPRTPSRPKLGDRSNSGNSAIIGRMKSVFSKSTNRSRSNSLLRKGSSEIDEFGNISTQGGANEIGRSQRMRPSTSSSSMASSTAGALRGRSVGDETSRLSHDLAGDRSPRSSFTPPLSSLINSRHDTRDKPELSQEKESQTTRKTRVRASTISLAPTSYHFGPPQRPSSPNLFPIAATPPRRRPGTIHKLSNGLFGSGGSPGPSSPKNSLFPLPPRSSGSISSSYTNNQGFAGWEDSNTTTTTNGFLSPGTSPRPSTGSISAVVSPNNSDIKRLAMRDGDESAAVWLERIVCTVGRDEIANVLASSGDDFHTEALQMYMSTFDFTHNSLDVALRRLLMHMSLPKETQQIDRVIEAFSRRYEECEPNLFGSKDNTYVLAFSMMMLHTDAFNKSNKNKMTKVDYVRNTRMDGVSPIVLEAFFDNITYTPFVFIDDDTELKRSSGYESTSSTFGPASGKTKIDVYHMIVRGLLGTLRVYPNLVDDERLLRNDPFSFHGTRPFLDLDSLCKAFASAHNLIIPSYITSTPYSQRKVSGKLTTPRRNTVGAKDLDKAEDLILRVVKVGLLSRKDDTDHSSKKASRKWRSWSVILTSSQLLFFKDPTWALTLLEQIKTFEGTDKAGQLLLPRQTTFKPDEVFSMKDCVAVFDRSFSSYPNTFRFVMPQSRQYLLQSSDASEMNEWISLINYAATFKTVNLKMKGPSMRKDQVVLAGAAAAASHKRELRDAHTTHIPPGSAKKAVFGDASARPLTPDHSSSSAQIDNPVPERNTNDHNPSVSVSLKGSNGRLDVDETNEVVHEGEQLEEVFGVVKAELAAGRGEAGSAKLPLPSLPNGQAETSESDRTSVKEKPTHIHTSRVSLIYSHLAELRKKAEPIDQSLRATMSLIRNISLIAPFLKPTRDKLSNHMTECLHKLRHDRLILAKLKLYIKVLEYEGEREDREWKVVRHVALQAAARSLREDSLHGVVKDVNQSEENQRQGVPKLTPPLITSTTNLNALDPGAGKTGTSASASDTEVTEGQDGSQKQGQTVEGMNSPVELPEFIRRSSDEPPSNSKSKSTDNSDPSSDLGSRHSRDKSRPSTSTGPAIRMDDHVKKSTSMRKSNSASDLLAPDFNVNGTSERGRRSSEVEETSPRTDLENDGIDDDDKDDDDDDDNANEDVDAHHDKERAGGSDTPMMLFNMESPLDIPTARLASEDAPTPQLQHTNG
uniref:SEC7 domain-containing protein n=1 Tax=Kwoniella dejecticola CBS 10117 TaxID=1296121 RepID=A0A1A5ZVQ6_9TREE|nr:uncharacterized protein I303_07797 [Kwoniella dejecticola CBS 10117]OBR81887.1 hypothetical protein I303_07797 [Kwoniella dejecticola CBS 10117]